MTQSPSNKTKLRLRTLGDLHIVTLLVRGRTRTTTCYLASSPMVFPHHIPQSPAHGGPRPMGGGRRLGQPFSPPPLLSTRSHFQSLSTPPLISLLDPPSGLPLPLPGVSSPLLGLPDPRPNFCQSPRCPLSQIRTPTQLRTHEAPIRGSAPHPEPHHLSRTL